MNYTDYIKTGSRTYRTCKRRNELLIEDAIMSRLAKVKEHTKGVDLALLKHLKDFSPTAISIKNVDADFCHAFAKYLVGRRKIKVSSAAAYLQKLHAVLQDAVYAGYLKYNPMPPMNRLLPKYVPAERACLTVEEIHRLEKARCPHTVTKLAFLFSCYTGLRLSDIETLRWEHLRMVNGIYMLVKVQVKTNSEVRVPIGEQAAEILETVKTAKITDGNSIFPMPSRTTVYTDLRMWAEEAGIEKHVTFHVSRISFVTLSVSAGINMYVISKLCGHKNIKTTQIYARMIDHTYHEAINLFTKLFRCKKTVKEDCAVHKKLKKPRI